MCALFQFTANITPGSGKYDNKAPRHHWRGGAKWFRICFLVLLNRVIVGFEDVFDFVIRHFGFHRKFTG